MRTNCNNCGAPLTDGKCLYCGTKWFSPGISVGEHGMLKSAVIKDNTVFIDSTCFGDNKSSVTGLRDFSVELEIIGLKAEEIIALYKVISDSFGR